MKVVELNRMNLVGIRVICPGDQYVHEIPRASVIFKERLNEISGVVQPARLIGAFFVEDLTEEEDGYWVCVEVNDITAVPDGMVSVVVPKQKYAVQRHKGPNYEVRNTYEELHNRIKENKHERLLRSWHLEISDEWGDGDANHIEVDLYDTIK